MIILAILLLEYRPQTRRFVKFTFTGAILFIGIIIAGEMLRYGYHYAASHQTSVLTLDVFLHTIEYLLQAYIGSDLNNTFVILDSKPSMQYVSTASGLSFIFSLLGMEFSSYNSLPLWTSSYGTVNVIGLWWFDMGWVSFPVACILGYFLGFLYKVVILRKTINVSFTTLLFLISYPGFISISRINYYGLTIFIIPLLYIIFSFIFYHLVIPNRKRYIP